MYLDTLKTYQQNALHLRRYSPGSLTQPLKSYLPRRKLIFQPSFFRGYVKLRWSIRLDVQGWIRELSAFLWLRNSLFGGSKNLSAIVQLVWMVKSHVLLDTCVSNIYLDLLGTSQGFCYFGCFLKKVMVQSFCRACRFHPNFLWLMLLICNPRNISASAPGSLLKKSQWIKMLAEHFKKAWPIGSGYPIINGRNPRVQQGNTSSVRVHLPFQWNHLLLDFWLKLNFVKNGAVILLVNFCHQHQQSKITGNKNENSKLTTCIE